MKQLSIKRIGVSSFANLVGVWNAIIGIFLGISIAVSGTITMITVNDYSVIAEIFLAVAIILGSIILVPLFLYVLGWLYGVLIAFVLNLVVGVSGGINIDVEESKL